MALLLGFAFTAVLGIAHHFGLLAIRAIKPNSNARPQAAIMLTFLGLLALHALEILAFAMVYGVLLAWGAFGDLGGTYDATWGGLIYEQMGFDERLRRLSEYYLAYSEAGFRSGIIDVRQMVFARQS